MAQYNEQKNPELSEYRPNGTIEQLYEKTKSWINSVLGIIILFVGVALIFVISSLEGTKEVKASNSDCGKIMNVWREQAEVDDTVFPQEKVDIVQYGGHEYYFIIAETDPVSGAITDWYFAFDGDFAYIFKDYKFYILTGLTIVVATFVAITNYTTTVQSSMNKTTFGMTMLHYQNKKKNIEAFAQYIPDFCIYKNKQTREMAKRDIVEKANIDYDFYNSKNFDPQKLERWQKQKLKKIQKIKVQPIHSSDLLQEHNKVSTKIVLLPMSEQEHRRKFMVKSIIQKIITSALSGMVFGFGVKIGNWALGITYAFTVLMSFVSAITTAKDFVDTTLRNRFLAKGDLLGEFDNIKQRFIDAETERQAAIVKAEKEILEQKQKEFFEQKQKEAARNKALITLPDKPRQEQVILL